MRKLLLGVAAIGLSGCSWLGLGGQQTAQVPTSVQYGTYSGQGQIVNSQGQIITRPNTGTWQAQPLGRTYDQAFNQGTQATYANTPNRVNSWRNPAPANFGGSAGHQGLQQTANKASNGCCVGGKTLSRWNVEAGIGPEFFIGGDAISGNDINNIPGVTSDDVSFNDVYGTGIRYDLGASYALNPNRKVTANLFYATADSDDVTLGNVNGEAVTGRLDDYERYGAEVGLRQYARPIAAPLVNSVRPYVEGKVGVARIRDIDFVNSNPNATALAGTTPFYDGGWVPTGAGLVGIETPVFNRFTVGVESGIRYTATPESDTSVLGAGVPLAGTNNGGANWSIPLQIRGRYRF